MVVRNLQSRNAAEDGLMWFKRLKAMYKVGVMWLTHLQCCMRIWGKVPYS